MASKLTIEGIEETCSLSCEMSCDFKNGGEIKIDKETGKIESHSESLQIRYGKDIFLITKIEYCESIHTDLLSELNELQISCYKQTNTSGNISLKIYLPLASGSGDYKNKNGKTIEKILDGEPTKIIEFEQVIPMNTPYIMYTDTEKKCACVVLSDANIIYSSSDPKEENAPEKINQIMKNVAGLKLHSSADNRIETIECLPINDDGILLADIEKGLGDTNITERFNLQQIIERLLKIPALRIIGGAVAVIILYKLMSSLSKKKNIGVKTMSEINK